MQTQGGGGEQLMKRGYPSLFAPDSDEEYSSGSESAREEQARPSLLPLEVSNLFQTCLSHSAFCWPQYYSTLVFPGVQNALQVSYAHYFYCGACASKLKCGIKN